jgi:hypothetical protein
VLILPHSFSIGGPNRIWEMSGWFGQAGGSSATHSGSRLQRFSDLHSSGGGPFGGSPLGPPFGPLYSVLRGIRPVSSLARAGWMFFGAAAFTFLLFQKKLLPKNVSRVVSSLFFVPTFPFTVLMRLNNYWTPIDETVILGTAPVGFMGHPEALHKLGKCCVTVCVCVYVSLCVCKRCTVMSHIRGLIQLPPFSESKTKSLYFVL